MAEKVCPYQEVEIGKRRVKGVWGPAPQATVQSHLRWADFDAKQDFVFGVRHWANLWRSLVRPGLPSIEELHRLRALPGLDPENVKYLPFDLHSLALSYHVNYA
jgi:hypothetical protein